MSAPELTPQALSEIKMWLWIAGVLCLLVLSPFIASWWFERKNRILKTAEQYYCSKCRRGTDWTGDKSKCLECPPDNGGEGQ